MIKHNERFSALFRDEETTELHVGIQVEKRSFYRTGKEIACWLTTNGSKNSTVDDPPDDIILNGKMSLYSKMSGV